MVHLNPLHMQSKTCLFLVSSLLFSIILTAQKVDMAPLKQLAPRSIGPAGMSGRVTSIDVDLSNSNIIYVGTASGGLWRSENGGISWEALFDKQPVQSIGSVAVNQRNPSEIWAGTGEGNPRNSQNSGEGIFKSIDRGRTWKLMGLKETKTIHRIIIHKGNPDIVFAAAMGSAWGPNTDRGVFRTKDGGKTWEKILYVNDRTGCADLVVDPGNPNKLIAAMWEYARQPWAFQSGGPGSGLYVSYDGGDTWTKRTEADGLPKGELGRMGLAFAPSKPNIVYALIEAKENALFKSTDGGVKWQKINDKTIGDRPFYYADIFVDPKNENRVYNLFSLVSRSEDGGKSFETLLPYSGVHPDHHAFWVHPDDPDYLIEGNDGGLNISHDGGKNWRFIDNLPLAQLYHVNYDMDVPYNIGGGMQDNGSWVGPSAVWKAGGITNSDWQEVDFGDGFDVGFRPDNNRFVYAMSQGGSLSYIDRTTGRSQFIKPTHPNGTELRFNWNAAFAQNPFNPCGVYYGSQFLHKSLDCGQSWEIISPDLTTNDTTKQQQDKSGGLTPDVTAAENHTTILAIAPSTIDPKLIWVGTDDGNLQLTRDGGQTWTNLSAKLPGVKAGSWIPYIELSRKNAGEAFIIVNDYRRNDWRPMAFHTIDYGATFTRIVDESKVSGHALSIVQDPIEPDLLWLGTDFGLYFSIDAGANWTKWTEGFPSVSTADLKIHPRDQDLMVATFGRAFWIFDDIRPIREIARTKGKVLEQPFKVFEAPDAYLANYRDYQGMHFPADGTFIGENKRGGAMITIWVKPEKEEMKKEEPAKGKKKTDKAPPSKEETPKGKKKAERVKIRVLDQKGDTIRTYSIKLDTGMNRIYWGLNRDGVRFPSRDTRRGGDRDEDELPGGIQVLPGTYKLLLTFGDNLDSTFVTVLPDPRRDVPMADLQARENAYKDFYKMVEKATQSFNQLLEARKTIQRVDGAIANAPDSTKQMISKLGKSLQDSLTNLENLFVNADNTKGIQRSSKNLNNKIFQAFGYLNSTEGPPNQAAQRSVEQAHAETVAAINRVNTFMAETFADYQKKVEAVQYSLFKPVEAVKMDQD